MYKRFKRRFVHRNKLDFRGNLGYVKQFFCGAPKIMAVFDQKQDVALR
jgi:hypothetical protein